MIFGLGKKKNKDGASEGVEKKRDAQDDNVERVELIEDEFNEDKRATRRKSKKKRGFFGLFSSKDKKNEKPIDEPASDPTSNLEEDPEDKVTSTFKNDFSLEGVTPTQPMPLKVSTIADEPTAETEISDGDRAASDGAGIDRPPEHADDKMEEEVATSPSDSGSKTVETSCDPKKGLLPQKDGDHDLISRRKSDDDNDETAPDPALKTAPEQTVSLSSDVTESDMVESEKSDLPVPTLVDLPPQQDQSTDDSGPMPTPLDQADGKNDTQDDDSSEDERQVEDKGQGKDEGEAENEDQDETPKQTGGFFKRISRGLSRSSQNLSKVFTHRKLDDDALDDLEDELISADLGAKVATQVRDLLAKERFGKEVSDHDIRLALAQMVATTMEPSETALHIAQSDEPQIILMVGVNGSGKTTTAGKLAQRLRAAGKSVLLVAADTFRAAAVEQLKVWGERTQTQVIAGEQGADAAGLIYDSIRQAQTEKIDIVIADTAGRLQNKQELMDELAKIVRVMKKLDESAPHHVLLVLDATVGQNAISQTRIFSQVANVTGLVMTKLDGTAKGGVLVSLAQNFDLPIHYIGVGEQVNDLQPFNAEEFARALTGLD